MALFFGLGKTYQSFELIHLQTQSDTLRSKIEELEARNHNLVQQNAQLAGSSRIEHDAYLQANQTLIKLQQQMLAQKEELAFYQGIVSPTDTAFGVNLQSFEVKRKNSQNLHSYKLVLTKRGESNRKLQGSVNMVIRGEADGVVTEFELSDIKLDNPGKASKYSFKYFQVLEGDIAFPEGFTPYEVEIGIYSTTKKVKSFSETISWASVLSEDL